MMRTPPLEPPRTQMEAELRIDALQLEVATLRAEVFALRQPARRRWISRAIAAGTLIVGLAYGFWWVTQSAQGRDARRDFVEGFNAF